MSDINELELLKEAGEASEWCTEEGLKTLQGGYLLPGETPRGMYRRIAKKAASYYSNSEYWENRFFDALWKNWLCPASPICSNGGTERGLPISCLAGDTWVNTKENGKQIKDIEIGDEVLTHEGRYRKVIGKTSRMSNGDLFKLKVKTRQTPTYITGNHQILTNLGMVRVDELDINRHYIATNSDIEYIEKSYTLDMLKYCKYEYLELEGKIFKKSVNKVERKKKLNKSENKNIVSYYAAINRFVKVDEDLAWALGLWFAEGSKSTSPSGIPNGTRITLNVDEEPEGIKWLEIMKDKFNVNGNTYVSEISRKNWAKGKLCKWLNVNVHSSIMGNFVCEEFGLNCLTKTIPQWILDLPKYILFKFLEGMIFGDGSYLKNGTWRITVSNPKLLLGIYNICLKLGIFVSLQMQSKPGINNKTKYVYTLCSLKKDNISINKWTSNSGIKFGKLVYCPIELLDKVNEDVEVYDIEVEEDNTFSFNGVVGHNCNTIHVHDSVTGIFEKVHELAMLSKHGAGVGIYVGDIRGRGAEIKGNGTSDGVIPWMKIYDSTIHSVNQGSTRRGAAAAYLPIEHLDIEEFINIRRPIGDMNRRCLNLNHGVCITDKWMVEMLAGDEKKRHLWRELIKTRQETGEPYIFFTDHVNNNNPECYKQNGLDVKSSNICSEVTLFTDPNNTFVCCLSSLNLVRYDEWKDTDLPELATRFLDAILSEYIEKSENIPELQHARNSAINGRAIGIGVLGWHSYLQEHSIAFDSYESMRLNNEIFRKIREGFERETKKLAEELGEPYWCKGFKRRNSHGLAVAPTVSNSTISGGYSAGIEPIAANVYSIKSAKGTFIRYNPTLRKLLKEKNKDNPDVWKSITAKKGSVQHLDFLSEHEKEVFLTAREINQYAIVKQAAQRQKYIDQSQSVNLFFGENSNPAYINNVHIEAWRSGMKTLYYLRTEGVLSGDLASRSADECAACEA